MSYLDVIQLVLPVSLLLVLVGIMACHATACIGLSSFLDLDDDEECSPNPSVLCTRPHFSHTEPLDSCDICRLAVRTGPRITAGQSKRMIATLTISPSTSADSFDSSSSETSSLFSFLSPVFPPTPKLESSSSALGSPTPSSTTTPPSSIFIFPTPPQLHSARLSKLISSDATPPSSTQSDEAEERFHDCSSPRSPSSPAFALPSPNPIHESVQSPSSRTPQAAGIGMAVTTNERLAPGLPVKQSPAASRSPPRVSTAARGGRPVTRNASFRTKPLILGLGLDIFTSSSPDKASPVSKRRSLVVAAAPLKSTEGHLPTTAKEKRTSIQSLRYTTTCTIDSPPLDASRPPSPTVSAPVNGHCRSASPFRSSLLLRRSRPSGIHGIPLTPVDGQSPADQAPLSVDSLARRRGHPNMIPLTLRSSIVINGRDDSRSSKWSASTGSSMFSSRGSGSPCSMFTNDDTAVSFLDLEDSDSEGDEDEKKRINAVKKAEAKLCRFT